MDSTTARAASLEGRGRKAVDAERWANAENGNGLGAETAAVVTRLTLEAVRGKCDFDAYA
jgi:hypothetical protein